MLEYVKVNLNERIKHDDIKNAAFPDCPTNDMF
jgi:hypothetical protein